MSYNHSIRDFLRFSLDDSLPIPSTLGEICWDELLAFGEKQQIMGILFHGLEKLTSDLPHPPQALLFKSLAMAENIKRCNKLLNSRVNEIVTLFEQKGFQCCLLKGQGNASMYPHPFVRTPGDIDLWVMGDYREITAFCKSLNPAAAISYHHAQLLYKDVVLEVHFHPSYCGNLLYNLRLQRFFDQYKNKGSFLPITLTSSGREIPIPSYLFNRVFQMSHIMKHFLYEGIGLRQIIDYYYLLKCSEPVDVQSEEKILKHLNLHRFGGALMYVLHTYLGLDARYLTLEPQQKDGEILLEEIFQSGNFGHYDERFNFQQTSRLKFYTTGLRRASRFALRYPAEVIWGRPFVPLWRRLLGLVERKIK